MSNTPTNLLAAVRYFSDLKVCNDYMRSIKWPHGQMCCHSCGSVNVYELSTRPIIKCRDCKKQASYKVGTIFEDSPLGLDKWFVAVWAIANAKNGIRTNENTARPTRDDTAKRRADPFVLRSKVPRPIAVLEHPDDGTARQAVQAVLGVHQEKRQAVEITHAK